MEFGRLTMEYMMEPQRTTPREMRRYGYATPPPLAFLGSCGDLGTAVGVKDGDAEGVGPGVLVPTRG